MPDISLIRVGKYICHNVDLNIKAGEIFVIVGTTGSGKTTLLNAIAGTIDYNGTIMINGADIKPVPLRSRKIGYLFQGLVLFPHLTVASNIAYGLRARKYKKDVSEKRVSSLMKMMNIEHLAERYPHMLSGGEKKRIALARALAPYPDILLLDEPTSSLDHQTSKYLRSELMTILRKLKITTIYVTHDLREAEEIADRIAVMSNGSIEHVSTPRELFFSPQNRSVAEFIGMPNVIECVNSRILTSGLLEVVTKDMKIILPYDGNHVSKIAIHPDDIYISTTRPPGPALNLFTGTVGEITRKGVSVGIAVHIGDTCLLTEMSKDAFDEINIKSGNIVYVVIKLRRLRYVEK